MKASRYVTFLSLLSVTFFVIYRQSDKKGFSRWSISVKTAVLISASVAGLLPVNTQANNQICHERLLLDKEWNSFENNNNQRVILVKAGNSKPSSVPTSPARGRPSQFPTPPKMVDQGANPAGAGNGGGAAEFDNQCPVSENKKSEEPRVSQYDYTSNSPKKKSSKDSELDENDKEKKIEIVYRIKKNPGLVREAEKMGQDQAA